MVPIPPPLPRSRITDMDMEMEMDMETDMAGMDTVLVLVLVLASRTTPGTHPSHTHHPTAIPPIPSSHHTTLHPFHTHHHLSTTSDPSMRRRMWVVWSKPTTITTISPRSTAWGAESAPGPTRRSPPTRPPPIPSRSTPPTTPRWSVTTAWPIPLPSTCVPRSSMRASKCAFKYYLWYYLILLE